MNKKIVLCILLLVLLALLIWWRISGRRPQNSIAQVQVSQQQITSGADSEDNEQQAIVPESAIASTQPSEEVTFTPVAGATTYTLGQGNIINWLGRRVDGANQGTIAIRQGAIQIKDQEVVGGALVLDMNTIVSTNSTGDEMDIMLKGDDYFDIIDYPTTSFVFQKVTGGQITGVLTMKGVSRQITFPGVVIIEDDSVVVTAEFAIDRKQWNIAGRGPKVSEFIELSFTIRFAP